MAFAILWDPIQRKESFSQAYFETFVSQSYVENSAIYVFRWELKSVMITEIKLSYMFSQLTTHIIC
jgi:hypothetical protein